VADPTSDAAAIRRRVAAYDWHAVAEALDAHGYARLPRLLTAAQCRAAEESWDDEQRFRSFIDMARHGYGEGHYRYFANPLPPLVSALRTHLYPRLARIANGWEARLDRAPGWPPTLGALRARCHAAGQRRPTPLLLRYTADGYNCLHQDRYGDVWFPLQVVCPLSRVDADYEGGELLLVEQRPRMQSRASALRLARGEGLIFPGRERPVEGARRPYRVQVRHGVSRLISGQRSALGVIFHDAL
jgi:hypothetical protein